MRASFAAAAPRTGGRVTPAQAVVDSLRALPSLRDARLGVLAVNLTTGDTLASLNPDTAIEPASSAKLAITAAALELLGPEARLATTLELYGIRRGVQVHGEVRIRGGGDPNLSARFAATPTALFAAMAETLLAHGVHEIQGDVVGDDTAWADDGPGPSWRARDLGEWYGAVPSALSYNDNCVDLQVSPGARPGEPAHLDAGASPPVLRIVNEITTGEANADYRLDVARDASSSVARIRGIIALGAPPRTAYASVPDPAFYAASACEATLRAHGIRVTGHPRAVHAPTLVHTGALLGAWTWPSRRVADLVQTINTRSQNLHAEMLLHALDSTNTTKSRAGGLRRVRGVLSLYGADTLAVSLDDGCGLGRASRVTPRAWVQLLTGIATRAPWAEVFWSSLPLAGRDSWLRHLAGTAAENRVRAKTGTLDGVRALAGRVETPRGDTIVFAFFAAQAPDAVAQQAACRLAEALAVDPRQ